MNCKTVFRVQINACKMPFLDDWCKILHKIFLTPSRVEDWRWLFSVWEGARTLWLATTSKYYRYQNFEVKKKFVAQLDHLEKLCSPQVLSSLPCFRVKKFSPHHYNVTFPAGFDQENQAIRKRLVILNGSSLPFEIPPRKLHFSGQSSFLLIGPSICGNG